MFLGGQLLVFLGVGALVPTLPLFSASLGLGQMGTGVVLSAPAAAMLLLGPPMGRLADERGRKPLIVAGLAGIALSDFATGAAGGLASLVPARLGLGAGRAVCEAGERAFVADLCARTPESRGRIVASQQFVYAVGFVLGPVLGGVAVERFGPSAAFFAVSLAAAASAVLYAALLPESRPSEQTLEVEQEQGQRGAGALLSTWRTLLSEPQQRGLLLAAGANSLGVVAKVSVLPLVVAERLGGPGEVGQVFSTVAALGLAAAPVGGFLSDRAGNRAVVVGGLLLCAAGFGTVPLAEDSTQLVAAASCWGAGAGMLGTSLQAYAQELAPEGSEGTALTLPKSVADVAFLVGPLLLGALPGHDLALEASATASVACALAFVALTADAEPAR